MLERAEEKLSDLENAVSASVINNVSDSAKTSAPSQPAAVWEEQISLMKSASLWTDEEAVKEIVMKELHLLEIFDSINEGIYILDKNGNYIYCNSAFLKMVGATKEEVESQNAFRLVQDGQVSVSVADLAFKKRTKVAIINNVTTTKG